MNKLQKHRLWVYTIKSSHTTKHCSLCSIDSIQASRVKPYNVTDLYFITLCVKYMKMICKKASQKLTAISRMSHYLSQIKRTVLIWSFFESQFNYGPLIWMFCGRRLNHKINKLHERALRIAYNDYSSSFQELLTKDDTVTIHQRNLRALAIEMYKISNDLSPPFMKDMMTEICIPYNTRSATKVEKDDKGSYSCFKKSNYKLPAVKTVSFLWTRIY